MCFLWPQLYPNLKTFLINRWRTQSKTEYWLSFMESVDNLEDKQQRHAFAMFNLHTCIILDSKTNIKYNLSSSFTFKIVFLAVPSKWPGALLVHYCEQAYLNATTCNTACCLIHQYFLGIVNCEFYLFLWCAPLIWITSQKLQPSFLCLFCVWLSSAGRECNMFQGGKGLLSLPKKKHLTQKYSQYNIQYRI